MKDEENLYDFEPTLDNMRMHATDDLCHKTALRMDQHQPCSVP